MLSSHSIIQKKQSGKHLSSNEIEFLINEYTLDRISDDLMSIWLRAIVKNDMDYEETLSYTQSMLNSGIILDFSYLDGYVIDKHSTGGVGDKVSLILGPILAACGLYVPMLAGRGLEHTGGTIDKLESIPGYDTSLSIKNFKKNVENVGISIMSQTKDICPADKKIYALRDITKTVVSFPLICGSIMSKKIAEGIQGLILDIKIGNGAFMKNLLDGKKLGLLLKEVGKVHGINVLPCYTNMNQPLGNYAGLWCEVLECVECLKGNGPDDLMNVVYHMAEKAMYLSKLNFTNDRVKAVINDGSALNKFYEMVQAHGGSVDCFNNVETNKPLFMGTMEAMENGYLCSMNTKDIGLSLVELCGGNNQEMEQMDYSAGIRFYKKTGALVQRDECLLEYFCSDKNNFERCKLHLNDTINIQSKNIKLNELIYK